jgi:hypothetical protein
MVWRGSFEGGIGCCGCGGSWVGRSVGRSGSFSVDMLMIAGLLVVEGVRGVRGVDERGIRE